MNDTTINNAVSQAKLFLKRHAEWKAKQGTYIMAGIKHPFRNNTPRENGALRRSSMDLSRALADMRRAL